MRVFQDFSQRFYRAAAILLLISAAPVASQAQARQCHYFWTSDCFEIRDAATRDVTHHVFSSSQIYSFETSANQCSLDALSFSEQHMDKVRERFYKQVRKVKGCSLPDRLDPEVFDDDSAAMNAWTKVHKERNFKQLHPVTKLPED